MQKICRGLHVIIYSCFTRYISVFYAIYFLHYYYVQLIEVLRGNLIQRVFYLNVHTSGNNFT